MFCRFGRLLNVIYSSLYIFIAAKEREKAEKRAKQFASAPSSAATSRATSPIPGLSSPGKSRRGAKGTPKGSGVNTPIRFGGGIDQRQLDMSGLNISPVDEKVFEELPKMTIAREKVIEEAKKKQDNARKARKRGVSLVVIGMLVLELLF